jgi:Hsp70 protein
LPSFVYLAHEGENLGLPWDEHRNFAVGALARARGAESPDRVVGSAKSWLSYGAVDRRAPLLPVGAAAELEKISPVEAAFRLLDHLADAFAHALAQRGESAKLADQEIWLTVPASFDAGARELTVEAALAAGLDHVTLLEEPQAALYAWCTGIGDAWRRELKPGDVVLVVDVGGGTTDFSAMLAEDGNGALELRRVAVGDHILLGGDNMDLLLAHTVSTRLEAEGSALDAFQQSALVYACRAAKEKLLAEDAPAELPIVVASRGARLVGATRRSVLTQTDVETVIMHGFFPGTALDEPLTVARRSGLRAVGLPYAQDSAITRQLAAFLRRQSGALGDASAPMLAPTRVLFNGGVMKSRALRNRVLSTLNEWLVASGAPPATQLRGAEYDLGVARGAAACGLARHGAGFRIRGGTARAYYVGIEQAGPAIPGVAPKVHGFCVAPFGIEEGTRVDVPRQEVGIVVGEPASFRFFSSSVRRQDQAGTWVTKVPSDDIEELPELSVTLEAKGRPIGDIVFAHLQAEVTEVGTLKLTVVPEAPLVEGEVFELELSVRS